MSDSTSRFGDRVDNYVRYRPGYPDAILHLLRTEFGLLPSHTVVDIGSGTGISAEPFLKNGNRVIGIEPNAPMRDRSASLLKGYAHFEALDGTAESTPLPAHSTDFIIAGQAFHWFDRERAKAEFKRILTTNGVIVLMWNERLVNSAFARLYDQLIIDHAIDYVTVDHRNIEDDAIAEFFGPESYTLEVFPNEQVFDFHGLKGRLSSSSYVPNEGHPGYPSMIADLQTLFDRFQEKGSVTIEYATKVYVCKRGHQSVK